MICLSLGCKGCVEGVSAEAVQPMINCSLHCNHLRLSEIVSMCCKRSFIDERQELYFPVGIRGSIWRAVREFTCIRE